MADEQEKSGSKMKLIIALVVILLAAGAGAFYFLSGDTSDDDETNAASGQVKSDKGLAVSYISIPEPFIFNLSSDRKKHIAQVKVQIMVRGKENHILVREHIPLVQGTILSTLSAATFDKVRGRTGRTELREQTTSDLKMVFTQTVGEPVIDKILFTDFVIQ